MLLRAFATLSRRERANPALKRTCAGRPLQASYFILGLTRPAGACRSAQTSATSLHIMRLAIVTDIHGNLAALEAVVADIRRRGVDQIVNLGDSLSGPLLALEKAQFIMAESWLSLAGNHERQILTQDAHRRGASDEYAHSQLTANEFSWLKSLAPNARLTPDIFLCHGTPASDIEYFLETVESGAIRLASSQEVEVRLGAEPASLVACGHTHVPRAVHTKRGQLVVNPGSVGLPAYDDIHPAPHAIETGSPDARYAIVEHIQGGWAASLLSIPYDNKSMAQLARLRGRPEWEHALLTGYLPQVGQPAAAVDRFRRRLNANVRRKKEATT